MFLCLAKEAAEVLQDPEGRWFSFAASNSTFVILEKKSLPDHLKDMDSLETVVSLDSLLMDLQDLGEVSCSQKALTWKINLFP